MGLGGEKTLTGPLEEVRVTALIGTLKVMKSTPAGGASRTVSVTLALPVWLQLPLGQVLFLFGKPLQEASASISGKTMKRNATLRFIGSPRLKLSSPRPRLTQRSPFMNVAPARLGSGSKSARLCSSIQ